MAGDLEQVKRAVMRRDPMRFRRAIGPAVRRVTAIAVVALMALSLGGVALAARPGGAALTVDAAVNTAGAATVVGPRAAAVHTAGAATLAEPLAAAPLPLAAPLAAASTAPSGPPPSPGPPFPQPIDGESVYDNAGAFAADTLDNARGLITEAESATGATIVVYTQVKPSVSRLIAAADASALLSQWQLGGATGAGLVLFFDFDATRQHGQIQIAIGPGYAQWLPEDERQAIIEDATAGLAGLGSLSLDDTLTAALSRIDIDAQVIASGGTVGIAAASQEPTASGQPGSSGEPPAGPSESPAPTASPTPAPTPTPVVVKAGPPYPPPVTGRRVYDYAGVFQSQTIATLQQMSDSIEQRTGAQIVVYTQVKPGVSTDDAVADAAALIDQWGIGRKGFDDGLVILFDLDNSKRHGQVQLYAGPGFARAFLSNNERQAIYEDDMLPFLRRADLDGAVLAAMNKVDEAASPAHAATLQFARQVDAVLGLVVAPLTFLLLVGWAAFWWLRYGRDPHYLDDPSVYAAGPPVDLTPASGAAVLDQGPSRRALTTALLDLASRGEITFKEDPQGIYGSVGLEMGRGSGSAPKDEAALAMARARPLGSAETIALQELRLISVGQDDGYVDPKSLRQFGLSVDKFDDALEAQIVNRGWFARTPRKSRSLWLGRGLLEFVVGIVVVFVASLIPISGLLTVGVALIFAGVVTMILSRSMPAVTMAGAMVRAMLAAYRRTLAATMVQARSMDEVVAKAAMPWLTTPDQAVVWGTAVGLQPEIEGVLQRSLTDVTAGTASASHTYLPAWWVPLTPLASTGEGSGFASSGRVAEGGGSVFSNSPLPNFGSMLAVLGTIGNGPISVSSGSGGSSSSFSSGGSFGGGSSGGGGGGAGGGF